MALLNLFHFKPGFESNMSLTRKEFICLGQPLYWGIKTNNALIKRFVKDLQLKNAKLEEEVQVLRAKVCELEKSELQTALEMEQYRRETVELRGRIERDAMLAEIERLSMV